MVVFDEAKHEYRLAATGELIPGVTSILSSVFDRFRHVKEDVLEYSRERGNAVHLATEFHDDGSLNPDSVHDEVRPYLAGYVKFLAREKPVILFSERPVYHPKWKYAGKPDRGVVLFGDRGILDIKTADSLDIALAGPQTAAYLSAKNSELNEALRPEDYVKERYRRRWGLRLGDGDYELVELKDPADEAVFLSCLNIKRWKEKHGFR